METPMTTKTEKILASDEAWDTGQLGDDAEYVKVIEQDDAQIDEALELQPISIRLQKSLIEDFRAIAALHGMSYQPLMRQVLTRFADCEKKRILRERVEEMRQAKEQPESPPKQKKAA
jgi:predicted DNA binding CopG/RHH family protein